MQICLGIQKVSSKSFEKYYRMMLILFKDYSCLKTQYFPIWSKVPLKICFNLCNNEIRAFDILSNLTKNVKKDPNFSFSKICLPINLACDLYYFVFLKLMI